MNKCAEHPLKSGPCRGAAGEVPGPLQRYRQHHAGYLVVGIPWVVLTSLASCDHLGTVRNTILSLKEGGDVILAGHDSQTLLNDSDPA